MLLDCVLTACNMNDLYYGFIPIFIKSWKKLYPSIDIIIILINDNIPKDIEEYKDHIILFNPIENIPTSFISQYIRLLYPCILEYNNNIMITDMDMIPMNKIYYTKNIETYDNNKFICLTGSHDQINILLNNKEIPICYNSATPTIWKEVFNINTIEDIKKRLNHVYRYEKTNNNKIWNIDQRNLYSYLFNWNNKTKNFILLNTSDSKIKRLNRNDCKKSNFINKKLISSHYYTDYHCVRPYNENKEINDLIVSLL